ncbi:FAD/NAD(P)-binding protein [Actinosynnema sp. CS-041913]|uniref:FAD/NAD(P)-binding protein n=1 Tax=Actinosynnema sp. CS-041913 TaxID=3239917 RepID=UPI003D900367
MQPFDRIRRVVVVGAGLGGTATVVRILRCAREPLEVVLVERRADYRNSGVAYQPDGNHWHHVFNIQAGRMSAFREDVDDFVNWANHEVDRSGWPDEWRGHTFTEFGPAPRRIYPEYLAARLAEAVREAAEGVVLVEADGEVVDIEVTGDQVDVVIEGFAGETGGERVDRAVLKADQVILATGLEMRYPAFAAEVTEHPAFVRNPYSKAGVEQLLGLRPDAAVAIVGTLLSAYDSATLLLRRGHRGPIHLISRSGLTLRTYPDDHRHRVIDLPPPDLKADGYEGREEFVRRFTAEWERACAAVAAEHPDVAPEVIPERVAKSWEPHLPAILERVPSADLRWALDTYGSLLAVLRVGAMSYTTETVDAALATGRITLTSGTVEHIRAGENGSLVLSVAGRDTAHTIEADLVLGNFGRESDYTRADSTLWVNLLRRKTAVAHRRTGRGVEVDAAGNLVGSDGAPSGPILVVGSPREGDELVRNGRTGAFTFNLAAIKNHSVTAATTVLHRIESCFDEQATALTDTADHELHEAFTHSVTLDVRRMAARRRTERNAHAIRLERGIRRIRDITFRNGGKPVSDRALRFAVNAAATVKLTDLSVTPRDLRTLLGLDGPEGPTG